MHLPLMSFGAVDAQHFCKSVLQLFWLICENIQGLLMACVKTMLFIVGEAGKQPAS